MVCADADRVDSVGATSKARRRAALRPARCVKYVGHHGLHPALAQAFYTFNGHLLNSNSLSIRHRETIVLRVAAVKKSGYEWAQHLLMAKEAGLTDREIAAVAYGPDSPLWAPIDAAVVRSVDDFIDGGGLSDTTWTVLSEHLEVAQILDLLNTIGAYITLAGVIQSSDLS